MRFVGLGLILFLTISNHVRAAPTEDMPSPASSEASSTMTTTSLPPPSSSSVTPSPSTTEGISSTTEEVKKSAAAKLIVSTEEPSSTSLSTTTPSSTSATTTTTTTNKPSTTVSPYPQKPVFREFKFESCSFDDVDQCARAILFYGDRDQYLAKNEREMKTGTCPELKGALRCAADWSRKCLKGLPRQILNVMINGPAKNSKERCEPRGTAWYLRSYECVTDSRPDIDTCMDNLKREFGSISRSPKLDDWLPTGCCFFNKFMSCFDRNIRNVCNEDGVKYLHWCRDAYLGDMVDLICSKDHDHESSKCTSLFDKIMPPNGTEPEPKSVLLPVYAMFNAYEKSGRKDIPSPF